MVEVALDQWAKLNVEMDSNAKAHLQECTVRGDTYPADFRIGGAPWSLSIGDGVATSNRLQDRLQTHINSKPLFARWSDKGFLTPEQVEWIDWEAGQKALLSMTSSRQRWVSKHTTGMCGVGKFLKLWKQQSHDKCPRCGQVEDAKHVWTCPDAGACDV